MMIKSDLGRRFYLDVSQSGHVFIREPGGRSNGTLPVYSTDTREEAESIRVFHCRLARDASGLYQLNEFSGDVDDLGKVSAMFRETHHRHLAREKELAKAHKRMPRRNSAIGS